MSNLSAPHACIVVFALSALASPGQVPQSNGLFVPPVGIQFESPDPPLDEPDLGWLAFPTHSAVWEPVAWGVANQSDRFPDVPPAGFECGNSFFSRGGAITLSSLAISDPDAEDSPLRYRVNLENYRDVEVSFGLRVDDTGARIPGFETTDSIRFFHLLSDNGVDFLLEEALTLTGATVDGGGAGNGVEVVPLIEESDLKSGFVPTAATHAALGDTWRDIDFDDSGWHSFSQGLGYDTSNYLPYIGWNTQSAMRNINATCYMRIPFEVADKSDFESLTLYLRDDDGYVVYLNGTEIARNNAPLDPTWDSNATANRVESGAEPLTPTDVSAHLDILRDGSNVLAVHCLNRSKASSDFLVSAELTATRPDLTAPNDPPESLNDINNGIDGAFYEFRFPVADSVASYGFEIRFRSNEPEETMFFDKFEITGTPIAVDGYNSWIQLETSLHGTEAANRLADPDGDGIVNLLEFAFGSDPELSNHTTTNGDSILPAVELVEEGGDTFFEISWRQRSGETTGSLDFPFGGYAVQGVRYVPQFSSDAEFWTDSRSAPQGSQVGEPVDNGDGTHTYRMRYGSDLPDGGDQTLFGRLAIILDRPVFDDGL